jgi:uncharacterized membrane protein YphA (DoxX/SURF4 family)
MLNYITKSWVPTLIPRITAGLVFLSEGIQKFLLPDTLGAGRFAKIGIPHPEFWAPFTACFEITCGIALILGLLSRLAAIPLVIVMIVAFITTKYPELLEKGFWFFAHDYRPDFAMTMLLIFIICYGSGKYSLDQRLFNSRHILR